MHALLATAGRSLARLEIDDELIRELVGRSSPEFIECGCDACADWQRLPAVFGLSPAEHQLLALALAPEFDGGYAVAASRSGGGHRFQVGLAALAADIDLPDAHLLLQPAAALCANALITVAGDGPLPQRQLVPARRLIAHLAGDRQLDPLVAALAVESVPVDQRGVQQLAAAVRAGARLCHVFAPVGSAALSMIGAAARRLGLNAQVIALDRLADPDLVRPALRAAVLDAGLTGSMAVISGFEHVGDDVFDAVRYLELAAVPVVTVSVERWQPSWSNTSPPIVPAVELETAARARLWEQVRHQLGADAGRPDELVALHGLRTTPEQIMRAARMARTAAPRPDLAGLLAAAREVTHREAAAGLRRRSSRARRDDLILPPETAAAIGEIIDWARHREELFADRRLLGKATKGTGLLAMFSGPAGTGKTLAAEVIAGELGLDLQTVDLSVVVDKYIGETEKKLEEVFTQAEQGNGVLFFDEADALFGARTATADALDRYANQEIAYLLQRLEAFDGLALLATNLPGNLDPAFQRRLHFVVRFMNPDRAVRHRLWAAHLEPLTEETADPWDLVELAGWEDLTGGDIRNMTLAAAFMARVAESTVGMTTLRAAYRRELHKLGRRIT